MTTWIEASSDPRFVAYVCYATTLPRTNAKGGVIGYVEYTMRLPLTEAQWQRRLARERMFE